MMVEENKVTSVEAKLEALGLVLPEAIKLSPGMKLSFPWVRVRGNRASISGYGRLNPDGSVAQPLGKVGKDLSHEQAYPAAQLTTLAILSSLKRELGNLDRVAAWLRVIGMVNSAPGYYQQPQVINGFTDLIIELNGAERGLHARSAVGLAELPLGIPVEIEAEVEIVN